MLYPLLILLSKIVLSRSSFFLTNLIRSFLIILTLLLVAGWVLSPTSFSLMSLLVVICDFLWTQKCVVAIVRLMLFMVFSLFLAVPVIVLAFSLLLLSRVVIWLFLV